jgi:hypothetical protein
LNFLEQLNSLLSDFKVYSLGLEGKNTICFVDIDDTLFQTNAKVIVENKETGEEITQLSSSEFNSYKLKENEKFNFKQFTDASLFKTTSSVIRPTLEKLHVFQRTFKKGEGYENNKIIFITARANMDDKDTFLEAFERVGINVSDKSRVYIRRAGSELKSGESIHDAKARIMKDYLNAFEYEKALFFDDSKSNLKAFINLSSSYPKTDFIAVGVSDGNLFRWDIKKKNTRPVA